MSKKDKQREERVGIEQNEQATDGENKPKDPTKIFIFFWVIPIIALFVYATISGRCG